jgi:uncharacterized protein (TIGR02588 family)
MAKRPARAASAAQQVPTPLLEWIVAAAGLAFILAALGLIVFAEVSGGRAPPVIVVRAQAIEPVDGGWLVRFEARNPAREAAAEVQVTGTLPAAGGETRSVVLDYVPGGGVRRGGLLFEGDPRAGGLELAAEGYREP